MKKEYIPIIILVFLGVLAFVIFTKADNNITKDKAQEIGEEKYLEFLWMVDGAFNSDSFNEDFIVNDKKLDSNKKIFTCKYKNKKSRECIGYNFEQEFSRLFSKSIDYDKVYSDGVMYTWYYRDNNEYVFNNLNNCSINRMSIKHQLELVSISKDKLSYKVSFINKENNSIINKDFILVLEDNEWKINTAFYYDICGIKYYIY